MNEKRFTSIRKKNPVSKKMGNYIQDNGTTILKLSSLEDCKDVCEVLNEQHETIQRLKQSINELLYQIGYVGKNNKTCRECECFIPENKYCYMWDMEVEADDVVVTCDQRKVKNTKKVISDD